MMVQKPFWKRTVCDRLDTMHTLCHYLHSLVLYPLLFVHACTHILYEVPRLEFFNATAQEGGRSVLLEWELEYDGGEEVDTISVQVGGVSHPFLPAGRLLVSYLQQFDLTSS